MSAAVDAASLAAALRAADRAFRANYPEGYLGSTPALSPPALQIDNGRVVVDTGATASLPAGLISVMGFARFDIEAVEQAVRRDLDLALVLDASTSTSLAPAAQHVRDAFLRRCIQRDLSGRPCGAAVGR